MLPHPPRVDVHLSTNIHILAWRTVHLFWPQRSDAKLYQVHVHESVDILGPISNFFFFSSNPYDPGSGLPGALGRGQATASALGNFFKFWAYASTIIGAIVAGNEYSSGTW